MEKEEANSNNKPVAVVGTTGGGGGGDRLKRDEWSEGAVSCLLDAYETKWILRNRAKLKGHDSGRSPKTQTQCKNKIESMKKRYRSESSSNDPSSWPLFQRLDLLLRCRTEEDLRAKKIVENGSAKTSMETGSTSGSTPVSETIKEKLKMKETKLEKNKRRGIIRDGAAEGGLGIMRSEQARMETMKEVEKMRMEAEAKKGEMDLKRTEIMANTQLQIAKILANNGKDIDSSLRIGRS
ncbi:hypothetical protein MKW92_009695 [Papaver armeniacum]|nr:hypothetical protein MKW92_009695 [Papaver armeniacum]